jgi:hypothetical protein
MQVWDLIFDVLFSYLLISFQLIFSFFCTLKFQAFRSCFESQCWPNHLLSAPTFPVPKCLHVLLSGSLLPSVFPSTPYYVNYTKFLSDGFTAYFNTWWVKLTHALVPILSSHRLLPLHILWHIDPLLCNGRETTTTARQHLHKHTTVLELLLGSSLRATMEILLEVVFSMGPLRGYITWLTEWSEVSWLMSEWVSELEDCCGEVCSCGTGTVREPRGRGMSTIGSHYQTTGEDTVDWEDLVHAVVNCKVCEFAIAL